MLSFQLQELDKYEVFLLKKILFNYSQKISRILRERMFPKLKMSNFGKLVDGGRDYGI